MELEQATVLAAMNNAVEKKTTTLIGKLIPQPYNVEVAATVKLRGVLTRSEPAMISPTVNLLNKAVVAELCRRLGVTREAFYKTLNEIIDDAMVDGKLNIAKTLTDANPELLLALKEVQDKVIAKMPKSVRSGAYNFSGTHEITSQKIKQAK